MRLKKMLAVLLVSSMVMSMTACGTSTKENVEDNVSDVSVSDENDVDDAYGIVFESDFSLGEVDDGIYKSSFMNIGWISPDDWTFVSKDELNELNESVIGTTEDSASVQLEDGAVVCDMQAFTESGDNINIQIEKLSADKATMMDEKTYAEMSMEQIDMVFTQMGYSDVTTTLSTVTIAEKECIALDVMCSYEDVSVCQKLGLMKIDDYMCIITGSSSDMDSVNEIFANFYAL